jgi:hypothetical protein
MSNFCPEWVFAACCAKTAHDFLYTNNGLNIISKKFSNELSTKYNEIKFEEINDVSEKMLQFLSEINASEDAINFLNDYIYSRVCYQVNGSERKIKSMFSSAFDGEKEKSYSSEKSTKIFRANIFSLKNEVIPKPDPGWSITDVEDIDWLGELFGKEVDLSDL